MSRLKDIPKDIFRMITESLSFTEKIKLTFIRDEYNTFMKNKILKNQNNISIIDNIFRIEDFKTLTYYLKFVEKNSELHDELIFKRFNNKQLLNYSIELKLNKIAKILISIALSLDGYKFLNIKNHLGETPFLTAVRLKNDDIIDELLKYQYKYNILNLTKKAINGKSVLDYSLQNKQIKILKELINKGNIKNLFLICCRKGYMGIIKNKELNILKFIKKLDKNEKREFIDMCIFEAIRKNHLNILKYIFKNLKKKLCINLYNEYVYDYELKNINILLLAAINNHENIVNYLIKEKYIKINDIFIREMNKWVIRQSIREKLINKKLDSDSYEEYNEDIYFHDDFTLESFN